MSGTTEMKHTPGPWYSTVNGIGVVKVEALGFETYDGSAVLATMARSAYFSFETEKANARLAAAAPDLLAALLAVDLARHTDAPSDWGTATALSDAAIAKAVST